MNIIINMPQVGAGDCFIVEIKNDENTYNYLIDCGEYNNKVISKLDKIAVKSFDKVIASHIDDDHIDGLIQFLEDNSKAQDNKRFQIGDIWFNGYSHLPFEESGEETFIPDFIQKKRIDNLLHFQKIKSKPNKKEKDIGAKKALSLSATIGRNNYQWNHYFRNQSINVEDFPNELIINELVKIKLLSPTIEQLSKIEKLFRIEIYNLISKVFKKKVSSFDEVYEFLLRQEIQTELSQLEHDITSKTDFSESNILFQAKVKTKADTEIKNGSSISFIFNAAGKEILFTADANPDVLYQQLKRECEVRELDKIKFDAVKLSHHGSPYNLSNELLSIIDCDLFFCSGKSDLRPDIDTLSKLIVRPNPELSKRTLYFNYENDIVKTFKVNDRLKKIYNYEIVIDDLIII